MTKTANSVAGYIALLRQLAFLYKVGSAIARYEQGTLGVSDLNVKLLRYSGWNPKNNQESYRKIA